MRRVALVVHDGFERASESVERLGEFCDERGVELCVDASGPEARLVGSDITVVPDLTSDPSVDLCITLGGDGTILRGLRTWAGTGVPVFAVNFGQVGFLSTIEPDDLDATFATALDGAFDRLDVPAVTVCIGDEQTDTPPFGINDVSFHRRPDTRIAELGYGVDDSVIGNVRCDGLVACTAAGSTGYNLANGGPILAWGVEGYGLTFIAPHSLTARAIVVSPNDTLLVENRGQAAIDLLVDGRESGRQLEPGVRATLGYRRDAAVLAQLPGSSFYGRLREKFGHLSG